MITQKLITIGAYSLMAFIYGAGAYSCAKGGADILKLKKEVKVLKARVYNQGKRIEDMSKMQNDIAFTVDHLAECASCQCNASSEISERLSHFQWEFEKLYSELKDSDSECNCEKTCDECTEKEPESNVKVV